MKSAKSAKSVKAVKAVASDSEEVKPLVEPTKVELSEQVRRHLETEDLVPLKGRVYAQSELSTAVTNFRRSQLRVLMELAVLFAGLGFFCFVLFRIVLRFAR